MGLPGDLLTVVVTGTFTDSAGAPQFGKVTFTPDSNLSDSVGSVIIPAAGRTYWLSPAGSFTSDALVATDSTTIMPAGWAYSILVEIVDAPAWSFSCFIPHSPSPVDLSALTPAVLAPPYISYIPVGGGTATGKIVLEASPPLQITSGAQAGALLVSDSSGDATWSPSASATRSDLGLGSAAVLAASAVAQTANNLSDLTNEAAARTNLGLGSAAVLASTAVAQTANNLSDLANEATARTNLGLTGAATAPLPLAIANGGTGSATQNFTGLRAPTSVQTGTSYSVTAGQFAKIDSTAGAYTVSLPVAPADKTVIGVKLVKSAGTVNAVTVQAGGGDTFNDAGGTTLTLSVLNQGVLLQYNTASACWDVHADDLPLAALDSRYATSSSVTAETARAEAAEGLALQKASNLSDIASAGTARTNLGLGTAAVLAAAAVAQAANNLSDLASEATARTNLGLTAAATASLPLAVANGGTGSASRSFAGLLTRTAVKTSAYTASAGDYVACDSTSAAFTVTLPGAPADMTVIGIKIIASAAPVKAVTVAAAGSDVFNKASGTATETLSTLDQGFYVQYQASSGVWMIYSADLALSQLDARYPSVFNVKAYGAKGDGTTDDKAAILAAISAANGGVCYLPPGTYGISGGLSFGTNKVRLVGSGRGKTTIKALGSFAGFGLIYDFTSGLSGCTVEEITFDSDALATVSAIQYGTCANMTVRRCEVTNKTGNGWSVLIGSITDDGTHGDTTASTNIVFTDNWVHDNANGTNETVLAVNCRFSKFDNNYFYNNTNSAFTLNLYGYCNSSSACGNIFNNTQNSIFILASVNVAVNSNIIQAAATAQRGIDVSDSAQVTINSNAIQLFTSAGAGNPAIRLYSYGGTFDSHPSVNTGNKFVTISGNVISQAYYGIDIGSWTSEFSYNSDISVTDNVVQNTVDASIIVGRNDASATITATVANNRCIGSGVFGGRGSIFIAGYSSNVTIVNVIVRDNKVYRTTVGSPGTSCGISVAAATALVTGNDVTGTGVSLAAITTASGAVITTRNNPGYNPVGTQTPSVPATTVATTAAVFDQVFYITAGSSGTTTVAISGGPTITIPASACVPVRVPAGQTLTPTYTSAPTWVVEGE